MCVSGERLGRECLGAAGRAVQQDAARRADPKPGESWPVAERPHYRFDERLLELRLPADVGPRDVGDLRVEGKRFGQGQGSLADLQWRVGDVAEGSNRAWTWCMLQEGGRAGGWEAS